MEITNISSTLSEFLSHLRNLDIRLALDGERLACNAPKGALTPDIKAELQRRKAEILDFLRLAAQDSGEHDLELRPVARNAGGISASLAYPLSFAQQRLWFLDRMEPGNPIYNLPAMIRLTGALDRNALERSLREIVTRHDALRTVFEERDGVPHAVVRPAGDAWHMQRDDLAGVPADEREAEAMRRARIAVRVPFNLGTGPILRATLYDLAPDDALLLVVMHHIASDGWSMGVFLREMSLLYPAFRNGNSSPLEPLPVQYGDYTDWQRRWLEGGVMAKQLPYWMRTLAAPVPVVELPLDRPRPPLQTYAGQRIIYAIPAALTDDLKQFSASEQVTLFMTLLGAFQILLWRYSGQEDVVIGTAVANRDRPELAGLIGFFVNNVVLRTSLSGNPTVREYLHRVRQTMLDAFSNQSVPFDRLVEVLKPERSLNRAPLFQSMFILQNWPLTELELPDLVARYVEIDAGIARADLSIEAIELGQTLRFYVDFNADLFDRASMERMQQHFQTLLRALVQDPERRIADLPLLTPEESHDLVTQWNATVAPFPDTQCVHQLIDAQAARTPDAEAVRFEGAVLTYRQLVQRANKLAHHLRTMGVQRDTLVGIAVERTHEMVAAALAVWKAGGAYVPLDPSYPKDRLAFMMEDAGLVALVTETQFLDTLPAYPVVCLDRDRELIAAYPDDAPDVPAESRQLAYVIYTSGSTGRPKGVLVEHRSVVNFLTSMQREPGMQATDTLLSVTTLSFDIAGLELYLPLICGARVVLVSRAVASDGVALARALADSGATMMQATPATWRLLLEAEWRHARNFTVLCGGEALPRSLADALLETGAAVWNLYGPTETTIWSTIHRVTREGDPVSIGRPIANTFIYILDAQQRPVPVNVAGELYIGGDGLARGYHHRPELTAERFVPNPFVDVAGARMYRTGDQARYRADGTVEYLGRLDHQVKVRGFRIELGEIESVLAAYERIQHAVVMAREDVPGDQRLVAYLVTTAGERLAAATLKSWLAERLPPFMIPAAFVFLDAFPLTPNGKVDRRALPAPKYEGESTAAFISPRSGTESVIANIWRELLRVERVGTQDNFFDLGGHSLLVVQLQSRIKEQFRREISLVELFRRPTISAIAQHLSEQHADVS